jgi:uncharacterized membrane protein YsdA (DUF1294 family)
MANRPRHGGARHFWSRHDGRGLSAAGGAALAWVVLALALWVWSDWRFYLSWLIAGTLATFALYAFDKLRARSGGWRVPERVLLGFVLAGGVVGGWLGMLWLRHKTLHRRFWVVQWVATVGYLVVLGWELFA